MHTHAQESGWESLREEVEKVDPHSDLYLEWFEHESGNPYHLMGSNGNTARSEVDLLLRRAFRLLGICVTSDPLDCWQYVMHQELSELDLMRYVDGETKRRRYPFKQTFKAVCAVRMGPLFNSVDEPPCEVAEVTRVSVEESVAVSTGATSWHDVEITFLSDERVQVRSGAKLETRNYAEFGFDDRRSGKPNQAWVTLRGLAEANGVIGRSNVPWHKVEKRIQTIRHEFRIRFGLPMDPISFVKGSGYRAAFKIGCGPSFHR